jgi:hypothetical protein
MAEIAYHALTSEEKKHTARALRFEHKQDDIAGLLGVSVRQVRHWLKGMKIQPIEILRSRTRDQIDFCECPEPVAHHGFDVYCKRRDHCVYCGKARP